jgi:Cdc6-like AAA superfamily ATPase
MQLTSAIPSYFEQLSTLFMSIGRTCPRNEEYLLLYPRSDGLKEAVCEYFIVSIQLCKQAVLVLKRPLLGQVFSAMCNTIMSDLNSFEQKLSRLAGAVTEEIDLASRKLQVQEAEYNSKFRLTSLTTSTKIKRWRNEQMERRFLKACSTYDYQADWKQIRKQGNTEWFFKDRAYTNWTKQTVSSVLHCIGTLGSGKSVLTANVVDELASRDSALPVVYFFCRYDDSRSLSPRVITGSISRQIFTHLKADLSKVVSGLQSEAMGTDDIFNALQKILSIKASNAHKLCIVLDGIYECKKKDYEVVLNYLSRLISSSVHVYHIFFSTRPDVSHWASKIIPPNFTLSMSVSGCRDEMTPYIDNALQASLETGHLSIGNPDIITRIRDTLSNNAHGM